MHSSCFVDHITLPLAPSSSSSQNVKVIISKSFGHITKKFGEHIQITPRMNTDSFADLMTFPSGTALSYVLNTLTSLCADGGSWSCQRAVGHFMASCSFRSAWPQLQSWSPPGERKCPSFPPGPLMSVLLLSGNQQQLFCFCFFPSCFSGNWNVTGSFM